MFKFLRELLAPKAVEAPPRKTRLAVEGMEDRDPAASLVTGSVVVCARSSDGRVLASGVGNPEDRVLVVGISDPDDLLGARGIIIHF